MKKEKGVPSRERNCHVGPKASDDYLCTSKEV